MTLQEFTATVLSVNDETRIILNQTVFYPKSGGVEGDMGLIIREPDGEIFTVIRTEKKGDEIIHIIDHPGLDPEDVVQGIIDWPRRYELMRYHTAAHVLSGVFWNEGQVKVTGNDISIGQGRIDFNFQDFQRDLIEKFVTQANEIIKQDLQIITYFISREELEKDPSLTKLAMGIPKHIETIRIVEIKGYDKQPDGGCHVSSLKAIGTVAITKIKNKGKNNRRLYFELT